VIENKDWHKERVDYTGRTEKFPGKQREPYHPLDRHDGTGRGRGTKKEGHGKGNWGGSQYKRRTDQYGEEETEEGKEVKEDQPLGEESAVGNEGEGGSPKAEGEGESPKQEDRERRPRREEEVVDKYDEENRDKLTLDDYLASRKTAGIKAEVRKSQGIQGKTVEKVEGQKQKTETKMNAVKNSDVYNPVTTKDETMQLLAFEAPVEERTGGDFRGRGRGRGRGGRGRGRGRDDEPRSGGGRGQRNRMDINNEESFPALE